jgi:hypothetical protein
MSVSKKDFEAVAKAFRIESTSTEPNCHKTMERVAESMANYFSAANPAFDKTRFLKAAGFIAE